MFAEIKLQHVEWMFCLGFYRGNGRPAAAVLSARSQKQSKEVRAPSADEHISPQPHVLLLVEFSLSLSQLAEIKLKILLNYFFVCFLAQVESNLM